MAQANIPFLDQYKKYVQSVEPVLQNQETKNYSTVIFFFLVLSVFGWYAIRPTIQTILYLNREIKDKTEVNKKMDAKIDALIEANAFIETNQERLMLLDEAIPHSPDVLPLIMRIQRIAQESNASISALQIANVDLATPSAVQAKGKASTPTLPTYPFTLTIDGAFPQLSQFLSELINIRRTITLDAISIVPMRSSESTTSSSVNSLKISLRMSTYAQ